MHEVFLQRLAAHPVLRNDNNFRVFLEYKEDVSIISTVPSSHSLLAPLVLVERSWKERQRTNQWFLQNTDKNSR